MANNKWRKVGDFALNVNGNESENDSDAGDNEEGGDLFFENGDLAIAADAPPQHQTHNLVAGKGDLRAFPQAGVQITEFLNGEDLDVGEAKTEIELQLELDGQTVDKVNLDLGETGQIQIDAGYNL